MERILESNNDKLAGFFLESAFISDERILYLDLDDAIIDYQAFPFRKDSEFLPLVNHILFQMRGK